MTDDRMFQLHAFRLDSRAAIVHVGLDRQP